MTYDGNWNADKIKIIEPLVKINALSHNGMVDGISKVSLAGVNCCINFNIKSTKGN